MARVGFETVSKRFGEVTALSDFSMDIADGEFVVLVGPSGSGKTTALRLVAGLEALSSGEIRWAIASSTVWRRATATSRWCSRTTRCTHR